MTEVAANLLRAALGKSAPAPTPVSFPAEPYRIHPHHGTFAPGVPLTKINRLADELDTEAFLARQASRFCPTSISSFTPTTWAPPIMRPRELGGRI